MVVERAGTATMPRRYHSPSSIALAERCQRAWAEQYLGGVREPDREWAEIAEHRFDQNRKLWLAPDGADPITTRQRSTSLGKAVHAVFERRFQHGGFAVVGLPERIAESGWHLVPHPEDCDYARVEEPIGRTPSEPGPDERPDAPRKVLVVHGVAWAGFRDLFVRAPAELARLGVDAPDGAAMYDYKTTSSIARHALTPAQLERDTQASLYAVDLSEVTGLDAIPARWLYLETKAVRRAWPTDARMTRSRALDVLGPRAELAREVDRITCITDAPQNPLACGDYGPPDQINCQYHITNGGACNARRSIGALVQARVRKIPMALPTDLKNKFAALKKDKPSPTAEEAAEASEPADATPAQEPAPMPTGEDKPTPKPKFGKSSKAKVAAPADGLASTIGALAAELAEHEAARAQADAAIAEIRGKIAAAVGA